MSPGLSAAAASQVVGTLGRCDGSDRRTCSSHRTDGRVGIRSLRRSASRSLAANAAHSRADSPALGALDSRMHGSGTDGRVSGRPGSDRPAVRKRVGGHACRRDSRSRTALRRSIPSNQSPDSVATIAPAAFSSCADSGRDGTRRAGPQPSPSRGLSAELGAFALHNRNDKGRQAWNRCYTAGVSLAVTLVRL